MSLMVTVKIEIISLRVKITCHFFRIYSKQGDFLWQNWLVFTNLKNMIQSKSNSIVLFLCTSLRATTSEQTTSNENEIYEMHGGQCGGCIFPFIFQGRYHDSCTIIDGDSPWCSTVENLDEAEAGGDGGDCDCDGDDERDGDGD